MYALILFFSILFLNYPNICSGVAYLFDFEIIEEALGDTNLLNNRNLILFYTKSQEWIIVIYIGPVY